MTMMRTGLIVAILTYTCGLSSDALGGYITPVSATGTGLFDGSASVLIDGVIPPRGTSVSAPTNVVWNSVSTFFTIDFGSVQTVASLTVSVDNNDNYLVQSSTDGTHFSNLFTFLASDGPVAPNQGGLDILTTDSAYPSAIFYPGDSTTPEYVGRSFDPTQARYLRVSALSGDSVYGIGEINAFSSAVPEPTSIALCGVAGAVGLAFFKLQRRNSA